MSSPNGVTMFFIALSVAAGVLTLISGVRYVEAGNFKSIVIGLFLILFGVASVILELFFPPELLSWMGFYARWLGKGLWFLFIGILILADDGFNLIAGIFLIVLGCLYIILHFARQVDAPHPIRGHTQTF